MKLRKVISGGQTGADRAGLEAAKVCGIETGGHAPRGYRTLDGEDRTLKTDYGVEEHTSNAYPPRTEVNVRNADATLRFAIRWQSPGERCTAKFLNKWLKPYLDIVPTRPPAVEEVVAWLNTHEVEVLNIAGNSEKSAPGIYEAVLEYLVKVFESLQGVDNVP
ncbi:MAG: hypothetical protein CMK74_14735 [Pseudomonadales bacterium]|jgi:hypothetical protein|nr:hypothetical protein [Pseudomonadales bacterium]|tara:strand:+ start:503 stop:991 length:489 start_codon:yes stop_codon:yes gene_type:complete